MPRPLGLPKRPGGGPSHSSILTAWPRSIRSAWDSPRAGGALVRNWSSEPVPSADGARSRPSRPTSQGPWGKDDTPWDWLFLAMAHHGLGQTDLARAYFDRARLWIDQKLGKDAGAIPASNLSWSNRLELSLLRREAEAVLGR